MSLEQFETRVSNARWGEARRAPHDEGGRESPPLLEEVHAAGAQNVAMGTEEAK